MGRAESSLEGPLSRGCLVIASCITYKGNRFSNHCGQIWRPRADSRTLRCIVEIAFDDEDLVFGEQSLADLLQSALSLADLLQSASEHDHSNSKGRRNQRNQVTRDNKWCWKDGVRHRCFWAVDSLFFIKHLKLLVPAEMKTLSIGFDDIVEAWFEYGEAIAVLDAD
ncbi:hypothetical protein NE237_005224 [Protea cynaroides]|uniref:Uncharacterized protein n=1 Tax=Protea cynaroides TaxID=273540 RepID=A0A9Q0KKG1_9MAGN|nr:hypothetical protein NE237_005224 [Protea cynaroides]